MLFNGNICIFSVFVNIPCYSIGIVVSGWGGTDVRMEGRTEFAPCVLQDIGPLGPLPKKAVEQDSDIHFYLT